MNNKNTVVLNEMDMEYVTGGDFSMGLLRPKDFGDPNGPFSPCRDDRPYFMRDDILKALERALLA